MALADDLADREATADMMRDGNEDAAYSGDGHDEAAASGGHWEEREEDQGQMSPRSLPRASPTRNLAASGTLAQQSSGSLPQGLHAAAHAAGSRAHRELQDRERQHVRQHSPAPPRVMPRQGTRTGPILTDKHGQFPQRGESHTLPASQKGPMAPRRLRCTNAERSQQTLRAAKPPFTPHMPLPVCYALTPRHLRPKGVTENVFSTESIDGQPNGSTPEPGGSPRESLGSSRRSAAKGWSLERGRGIGYDIDPYSAAHSQLSWEPTGQASVRINAERRADRFKLGNAVVPVMQNEHLPLYYTSSGNDEPDQSDAMQGDDEGGEGGTWAGRTGEDWVDEATRVVVPTQFTRQRAGFNMPGSSDDGFRVARARRDFYDDVAKLGPAATERGFAMARTPPSHKPGMASPRTSHMFRLAGGIAVASEESFPEPAVPKVKTSSEWQGFKSMLHARRAPAVRLGVPAVAQPPQWPPREMITFRRDIERGLLPLSYAAEPATIDAGNLARAEIVARQARQL